MIVLSQTIGALSERTMIERALLAALEPLSVRQGGYLARLDLYSGELGAGSLDDILTALGGLVPAVLLQTSGSVYRSTSVRRKSTIETITIEVAVASAHLRSQEARVSGDELSVSDPTADPGVHRIIADVRRLLHGQDIGVAGAGVIEIVSDQPVMQAPQLTAWVLRFEVDYRYDAPEPARVLGPITTIEHRGNLEDSDAVNPVVVGEVSNG